MTGYAAEELLGRSARIVYPSQAEFERVGREKYQQIAKSGTGVVETRFRRKDGTFLDVLLASTPLDTADPSKGITFTALDITERKQAEAALRLKEARLESLLRINLHPAENIQDLLDFTLHEAIFLTGSKIGYIYFYDEDKKEFVLNTWSREVMRQCSVDSPPGVYQLDKTGIWGEAVRQRRPIVVNDFAAPNPLKKGLPEGHAPLRTYLTIPVFCQERIVAVVGVANKESEYNDADVRQLNLMMDAVWKIVQRKQAESERKSLQDQLLQAQKLESLGRLAGGVAHDFNNMLGVILGYAELTLQQMDANQPLSANLHEIRKAAERSAHLTRQLLAFARKQAVSPRVLDLNETVEGMLKMLRRLIGEDIDLTWMPGRNLWPVRVDPAQIDQILANLCVNARDAISGVGRITIETDAVRFDDAGRAGHPDLVAGHYVMLAVGDDGCGMDRQTLGNLFEPFFTTKEVGRVLPSALNRSKIPD
jgi:PAS domain S-box-containing protein